MQLSRHAAIRCQQRSIPPMIREWLLDFGAEEHTHGGTKRFFDQKARRQLAAAYGSEVVDRMGDLLNLYLVEGDDCIVTAGVRTRRIRRH